MLPWMLMAIIAIFDALICVNHFLFDMGSAMSFAAWQIIICVAALIVIFKWKKLSEIKPE